MTALLSRLRWTLLIALGWAQTVIAQDPSHSQEPSHSYALLVGSNRGGEGQQTLSFAERDAERVAQLLRELGRTPRSNIELLRQPTPAKLTAALSRLETKLAGHAERGERARVLFYYSGHARAGGLSLGTAELPLPALRDALTALPANLTVVVLDACQSGAISGVKGSAPAADFSSSSVAALRSQGLAIMASSTGSELSQESSSLKGSYFTHHLVAALRGAADADQSGYVSLDEAYRYAYTRTLADTSRTQVGGQHATFETNLTGQGDVPLTYTSDADAKLIVPARVAGRVLVQRASSGAVLAEVIKAEGDSVLLALPSDHYEVLVRKEGSRHAKQCEVTLEAGEATTLTLGPCRDIELAPAVEKHGEDPAWERWFVELGFGVGQVNGGDYIDTLRTFGFEDDLDQKVQGLASFGGGIYLLRKLALTARYELLERGFYSRDLAGSSFEEFNWRTQAITVGPRLGHPFWNGRMAAFGEASLGLAVAYTGFERADEGTSRDRYFGVAARLGAGLSVSFTKNIGAFIAAGYTYANTLRNDLGQRHQDGGLGAVIGARLKSVKGWW